MSWNERGDARAKRYQVYQQLEAHYNAALEALTAAKEEIDRKDALIRALAAELASLRVEPTESPKASPEASQAPAMAPQTLVPPDLKSSPYMHYPPVKPGLAKAEPKTRPNQTIAERLEELQQVIHGPISGQKEKG